MEFGPMLLRTSEMYSSWTDQIEIIRYIKRYKLKDSQSISAVGLYTLFSAVFNYISSK